ncbi:hypothetical protein THOG11_40204 [Vibrio harveyi]|nr:hypothetical protein THOG11_40204 [Vibrio harveyi]
MASLRPILKVSIVKKEAAAYGFYGKAAFAGESNRRPIFCRS